MAVLVPYTGASGGRCIGCLCVAGASGCGASRFRFRCGAGAFVASLLPDADAVQGPMAANTERVPEGEGATGCW